MFKIMLERRSEIRKKVENVICPINVFYTTTDKQKTGRHTETDRHAERQI